MDRRLRYVKRIQFCGSRPEIITNQTAQEDDPLNQPVPDMRDQKDSECNRQHPQAFPAGGQSEYQADRSG